MVEWLFLALPWGCLRFVIVVYTDHTRLLFLVGVWPKLEYQALIWNSKYKTQINQIVKVHYWSSPDLQEIVKHK